MRILFILILLSTYLNVWAQTVYNGRIYDVGTQKEISNALVHFSHDSLNSTYSNFNGDFILITGDSEVNEVQFFDNSMIWKGERYFDLRIASLNGQIIYIDRIEKGETYIFPRLSGGLYILLLNDDRANKSYKLLSDANETIKVDPRGLFHHSTQQSSLFDTLAISKEGYYTRELVIPSVSRAFDVPMLRREYKDLDYFDQLLTPVAFEILSSEPSRTNLGNVRQVKLVYDTKTDRLFYMNSKKYDLHLNFAVEVLGFDKGHYVFNQTQYTENKDRFLYLASLNYYPGIDKYVLQFVSAVDMSCNQIKVLYDKIMGSSFLNENQFAFFPIKPEWSACENMEMITSAKLYDGQTYQGLNLADNYGYLKFVDAEAINDVDLTRRDIVITNGIPNDLPVVAGIITSDLQTPLSHINVLSHSRNTPNMALVGAWDNEVLKTLNEQLVYINVKSNDYEIRTASIKEATVFWDFNAPSAPIILEKDVAKKGLIDLNNSSFRDVKNIGGKAANFAEMLKIPAVRDATPEDPFAIPFYYYENHFNKLGLDVLLNQLFQQEQFWSDAAFRKSQLTIVRDSIINSSIDAELIVLIRNRISDFSSFDAYRFRSSTNAEDIDGFSGAGLYNSYSAKKNNDKKTIESAVKKVWASLWNWRAFEEREYFKIDHMSCAMGILIHRSFPSEDANGVLISKNLYNSNPGYIINVQYQEYSIVFPKAGIINDQMILFTWSINLDEKYMLEYLSFSNLPELNGQRVLKDEEVFKLGDLTEDLKRHFYYNVPHSCTCALKDFGLDIEFKVDSELSNRKVYIKQARLFN